MSGACVVTTTVDSAEAAESLAKGIVEARLGACVQIVPIRSVYRWDGEVRVGAVWQCVVTTSAIRADELVGHIKVHHTYDVPEVIVTHVAGGNDDYLAWVSEETS
jgi:periplasmic divalent cation tolerance protein